MIKKYLIIGLGNPDIKFKYTRHNIGYLILQILIKKKKINLFLKNKLGKIYLLNLKNKKFFILLSNLYINLTGNSLIYFLNKFKLNNKNLIVISDDIYLNKGIVKIKNNSGHGGHNGLKSIEKILKTKKFIKIKIGIGHNFKYGLQNKYVLKKMNKKELNLIKKKIFKKIYNFIYNL
ncbi:MAG: aminoacyl-tRNA hydrolase [Candidatus Shikimatogenerans sp. JK-2022]|nr:aminoacyl-tRNA hydrolase [Candidatus Shikimatogenerans bostrichidophilus]